MKLATFIRAQGGDPEIGLVVDDAIHPAPRGFAARDMRSLIASWSEHKPTVSTWSSGGEALPLSSVKLAAPTQPGKILALGRNYLDHVKETNSEVPDKQVWFSKQINAINGPFDPIQLPRASSMVDYEVELVVVVGARCRHVSREEAAGVIFGYCVGNDVSARDWQRRTAQWTLGKSFDTHAPFGPWITTTDEITDPQTLDLSCKVNGEVRQSSNTCEMIFKVFDQIAELTQVMTLEPGDLIYTGTPSGVAMGMNPPKYLQSGDRVRCEIGGLGAIEGLMTPE